MATTRNVMEPTTSAAGFGLGKLAIAGAFGAPLAAIIVMSMATPQSNKEWVAALTSTVATSIFGGAALVNYFGWTSWLTSGVFGLIGIAGVMFACGLPAWIIVRAFFKYAAKNQDKDLLEMVGDIKDAIEK